MHCHFNSERVTCLLWHVQDIKHKVPAMESQYKMATRNAQLLTKDTPQEEVAQMLAAMATVKEQLSKVSGGHVSVREPGPWGGGSGGSSQPLTSSLFVLCATRHRDTKRAYRHGDEGSHHSLLSVPLVTELRLPGLIYC